MAINPFFTNYDWQYIQVIENIEQTLIMQNPHWDAEPYQHAFKRWHDAAAIKDLSLQEIQIVTGIRRCGKSTLLQVLINHLMQEVNPKSILYINFDDPNYTEVYENAASIYDIVTFAEKMTAQTIEFIFLDEVQNVTAWEKYVKSAYDNKRFKKIVITGSNADLLNSDYATLLSGRYIEAHLYPLSFYELLRHYHINDRLQLVKQKPQVLRLVDDMLIFGGFPRIQYEKDEENRWKLLKSYYETIVLKDCVANHNIRDTKTLMNLAYFLISNISSTYSYNSLGKVVESNETTTQQFIQIFQDAYFLAELKQFSFSLKSQMRAKKKIYCIDNGLINAATFKFSKNYGKLLENLVYTEFRKNDYEDIYYFHDQSECDFIVGKKGSRFGVQVCYELNHGNRDRELNGLNKAIEKFSLSKGMIITYDQEEVIDNKVQIIPFWKFFVEEYF